MNPSADSAFEGLEYNSETLEISYQGKIVGKWSNEAIHDYPEDLTWDRDIGSFAVEMFKAGQESVTATTLTWDMVEKFLPDTESFVEKFTSVFDGNNGSWDQDAETMLDWLRDEIKKRCEK